VATHKKAKVVRWSESDGGGWLSVLADHDFGPFEGQRCRRADDGDAARIFLTPRRGPMARSSGRNAF